MRDLMQMRRRKALMAIGAFTALQASAFRVHAEAHYPAKPIKLLNGSPPGSSFDAIGRAAAFEVEKLLGQPMFTDNKSGAGGTPAFLALKNAAPDGYTLAVVGLNTIRQPITQDVGYEGVRDFTWICSLAEINFGVVVPADSPFKTWQDLLNWARANPNKVSYGCPAGLGNSAHIFGSEVAAKEKADWVPVPYRASSDCMVALLGGELSFAIDTLISAAPQMRNGKVRLLALATAQRSKLWPEVPTMKELGYATLIESPVGIAGPAGLPQPIVAQLQEAFRLASERPAFQKLLEESSARYWFMPAGEFRTFAERAQKEQRALLSKYGYARK
ncbi:Bug family tripartite tricarboxylate transporter substrate binding protein [Variovorax sp. LT1R16]|uniref:Bug family tripartite tricarboxylate transporter substrate binding protein n=1 Tax=Variovorax sp. LT1R16 TaxID=3443728 RepID=UPI003F4771A9